MIHWIYDLLEAAEGLPGVGRALWGVAHFFSEKCSPSSTRSGPTTGEAIPQGTQGVPEEERELSDSVRVVRERLNGCSCVVVVWERARRVAARRRRGGCIDGQPIIIRVVVDTYIRCGGGR